MVHALKNLSLIGALFMIAGYGRASRPAEAAYTAMSSAVARRHGVTLTPRRIQDLGVAGSQAMGGKNILRRTLGHAGEAGSPSGSRTRGACESQNVS